MNYFIILGFIASAILLIVLYWLNYYSNLNNIVKGSKHLILKITPKTFSVFILLGLLVVISSFSIVKASDLENENNDLKKILDYERFDDGIFPNGLIKLAYEEYNIYFSGYYLDDNNDYVVCLTQDAPSVLTEALSNGGIQYIKVKFNYSELKDVYKIIAMNIEEYNFASVVLSMKNNRVEVTITSESIDVSQIQAYIQEGIVHVVVGDEYKPL